MFLALFWKFCVMFLRVRLCYQDSEFEIRFLGGHGIAVASLGF